MATETLTTTLAEDMANPDLFNGCDYNHFLWLVGTDADHPITPKTTISDLLRIDRKRVYRMLAKLKSERGY